jgi:hypothetical protein
MWAVSIVEMHAQAVVAKKHTHGQKQQQGRHPETAASLLGQDAGKEECRKDQKQKFNMHKSSLLSKAAWPR